MTLGMQRHCFYMQIDYAEFLPGDHFFEFGCGSRRPTKASGSASLQNRVDDAQFKKQIENDKVFTCEKHFTGEDEKM